MRILQGIDIVSVRRMQEAIERQGERLLKRVFTVDEREYCEGRRTKFEHYAARFAAKEAFIKAVPLKKSLKTSYHQIPIAKQPSGKPYIAVTPQLKSLFDLPEKCQIEISMAHERDYAIATVLVLIPS